MQQTHIIFAGCSFSDEGVSSDDFDLKSLKEEITYKTLHSPSTLKVHKYFALDLINQNIDNVKIHTIARGSYGNHVIFDKLKNKVFEIKKKYPNDIIYASIQLSALIRNGIMKGLDINALDYPYDYSITRIDNFDVLKEHFEKHIQNIEDIYNFCNDHSIKNIIYFGWANLFASDFKLFKLEHKIPELQKIMFFYEYRESYDEMLTYCSGNKPADDISKNINNIKTYYVPSDKFGGITEYGRDHLDVGARYHLHFDAHPSSKAYHVFYNDIIKQWFIDIGILKNIPADLKIIKMIDIIFRFEYIRFKNTNKIKQTDFHIIGNVSYNIISSEKMDDQDYIINEFNKINGTLT
jgi:hypothetical protein